MFFEFPIAIMLMPIRVMIRIRKDRERLVKLSNPIPPPSKTPVSIRTVLSLCLSRNLLVNQSIIEGSAKEKANITPVVAGRANEDANKTVLNFKKMKPKTIPVQRAQSRSSLLNICKVIQC